MITPAIGFCAKCRCGKTGPFADTKKKARELAVNFKWLDQYPDRADDKTRMLCPTCCGQPHH